MNQILDYSPNKSNKSSSGSDKIVRFFAILLIIFALCLVASGVYKMYARNSDNSAGANQQVAQAVINVEKQESTLKISVTHTKAIERLIYSWNDSTETVVKGTGENTLEKEIPLPAGTNTLHAKVVDVDGNETTYEEEIVAENGTDIINPVISLTVTEQKKLKITVTDETALDFITYRWNADEEVRLEAEGDKKTIETEIDILKGTNDITIIAVDSSNNTTTETKSYTGLTNPEITLTLSADKTKVNVAVKHENGLKGITGNINGQDFNVSGVEEGTTDLNFDLSLEEGVNKIKVIASSVEGTETTVEQEFTYGSDTNTNTVDNNTSNPDDNNGIDKPKVIAEQKADNNRKLYVELSYEKGLKAATLQLNNQNYDINIAENMTYANFELDLKEGENKILLTVVGQDGATQVLEKTFTVQ